MRWLTVLLFAAALSLAPWPAGSVGAAEPASASTWAGTVQGKVARSSRFASAGATMHGDFVFDVDNRGQVTGDGVVAYDPFFATDGLNALLAYARGLVASALGGLPLFGGFAVTQVNRFVGVGVAFTSLPVTRIQVSGRLDGGQLTLATANNTPVKVPFAARILLVGGKNRPLTSGGVSAPAPFGAGVAQVTGGRFAAATQQSKSKKGDVTTQLSTYWTAHRIGG